MAAAAAVAARRGNSSGGGRGGNSGGSRVVASLLLSALFVLDGQRTIIPASCTWNAPQKDAEDVVIVVRADLVKPPCSKSLVFICSASLSRKIAILHRGPLRLALLSPPVLFARSNIVLPHHAGSLTPSPPEIESPESCSRICIETSTAILACAISQHHCLFGEIHSRCFSGFFSRCFTAF
jgi:hypothetical protein